MGAGARASVEGQQLRPFFPFGLSRFGGVAHMLSEPTILRTDEARYSVRKRATCCKIGDCVHGLWPCSHGKEVARPRFVTTQKTHHLCRRRGLERAVSLDSARASFFRLISCQQELAVGPAVAEKVLSGPGGLKRGRARKTCGCEAERKSDQTIRGGEFFHRSCCAEAIQFCGSMVWSGNSGLMGCRVEGPGARRGGRMQ